MADLLALLPFLYLPISHLADVKCTYFRYARDMQKFETHNHIAISDEKIDVSDCAKMPVDLYETQNRVVVVAGMPRCLPNRIKLGLSDDGLTITGAEHEGEDELDEARTYHMRELPSGKIGRTVTLPTCKRDSGRAHFNNGILVVTFDKQL